MKCVNSSTLISGSMGDKYVISLPTREKRKQTKIIQRIGSKIYKKKLGKVKRRYNSNSTCQRQSDRNYDHLAKYCILVWSTLVLACRKLIFLPKDNSSKSHFHESTISGDNFQLPLLSFVSLCLKPVENLYFIFKRYIFNIKRF